MSRERSGGRWAWVAGMAFGLTLALAAMPAPSARSQTASVERFEGAWRYVGGERDQRGLHAAIDRVVDELDLFTREIARVAIRRSLVPEPTLHVRVRDARHLSLQLGDWVSHEVELGGAATQLAMDGYQAVTGSSIDDEPDPSLRPNEDPTPSDISVDLYSTSPDMDDLPSWIREAYQNQAEEEIIEEAAEDAAREVPEQRSALPSPAAPPGS